MKLPGCMLIRSWLGAAALAVALPPAAQAGWTLVDDFESYPPGAISDAGSSWIPHRATGAHSFQSEDGNTYLGFGFAGTSFRSISSPLPSAAEVQPGDQVVTLYLRFRVNRAGITDSNWGLSAGTDIDNHDPSAYFRVQTGVRTTDNVTHFLGAWDGSAFRNLTEVEIGTWYNLWYVIDQEMQTFALYLTTGDENADEADRLSADGVDTFAFRSTGGNWETLTHFQGVGNLGPGGTSNNGMMHVDDIWIGKDGASLQIPSIDALPGAVLFPYSVQFGSDGLSDGENFLRNEPSEWELQPDALRLTPGSADLHTSLALVNAVNFSSDQEFGVRARVKLSGLGGGTADNAVGVAFLGSAAPGEAGDWYFARWVPNGPSGSRVQIVNGSSGAVLADNQWTGRPASEGIGSIYTFLVLARDDFGTTEVTFKLIDEDGASASAITWLTLSSPANWFGIGAEHATGQNPVWDFVDFAVSESWKVDYADLYAPFSLSFESGMANTAGRMLLRTDAAALPLNLWDGLRHQSTGTLSSAAAVAAVSNYLPFQDFTVEAEATLGSIKEAGENRTGLVILGGPHLPGEGPFDPEADSGFYSLLWLPAVDDGGNTVSLIQIREGFEGSVLAEAVWGGAYPNPGNSWTVGFDQRYKFQADGVFNNVGDLELTFTLSDSVEEGTGHSQTVSTTILGARVGNLFGFGGRLADDAMGTTFFDYRTLAVTLGEAPGEVIPDPVTNWPFAYDFGSAEGLADGSDFRVTDEEAWTLEEDSLRLTAGGTDYENAFALTRVGNFEPGTDFFLRARFTVEQFAAEDAGNRLAVLLFGESDPEVFDLEDDSTYYTMQYVPASAEGGSLVVRQGMDGAEIARVDFSSVATAPEVANGSTFNVYFHARYDGDLVNFNAILADDDGNAVTTAGTLDPAPAGARFGFGARHRSSGNPVWSFDEFVWLTEPERPDHVVTGIPVDVHATVGRNADDSADANNVGRKNVIDPDTGEPRFPGNFSTQTEYSYEAPTAVWVGKGGTSPNARTFAGFLFFQLPAIGEGEWVDYAKLSLVRTDTGRATGPGNIDIYGFGYAPTTVLSPDWWYAGENDEAEGVVKLQNDFLLSGDNETSDRIAMNVTGQMALTDFLQSLYDNGAQPGDYAIIRMTYDVDMNPNTGATQRFIFQASGAEPAENDPILTIFIGGRTEGAATFADWQTENFDAEELLDPAVSGPDAAPAGDGVPNLLKYAMDLEAKVPFNGSDLLAPAMDDGSLTLTYLERTDISDIEYVVELSADLADWVSGPEHVEEVSRTSEGENLERVTVKANLSPEAGRAFLQLRIRQL